MRVMRFSGAAVRTLGTPLVVALALTGVAVSAARAGAAVAVPVASPEALAYHRASNGFWALEQALRLVLPALVLLGGFGARLGRRLSGALGGRRTATLVCFAGGYFLADRLIRVPVDYAWDRAYDRALGTAATAFLPWLAAHARGWGAEVATLALVTALAYSLARSSPERWWWPASAVVSLLVLAFLLLEPFTQPHRPLGHSPLEEHLSALAERAGIPASGIGLEHCDPPSSCPPGRVIGLGPTRLMLLNDALLARNPARWTIQTVAHEAKHFSKDDNRTAWVVLSLLALGALFVVQRAGRAIVARWPGPLGFTDLADTSSLPLVVLLLNALYVAALPPLNVFRRHVEMDADRFALALNHDGAAQAENLAAIASEPGRVPEWSPFFRLFRATHPSDAERIELANRYVAE